MITLYHIRVSQCFGETNIRGPLNSYCLSKFPVDLSNINYGTTGYIHSGMDLVDLADDTGREVYASGPGEVIFAGLDTSGAYKGGYGNYVKIRHDIEGGEPLYTRYAHLASINVTVGQIVDHTVRIGTMGESGNSTGVHLHFELLDGEYMNLQTIMDPTDIILRSRENPPDTCESAETPLPGCVEIGKTAGGESICMYQFGDGSVSDKKILLVGAVHGGYEPNTIVLGYQMLDYFKDNPDFTRDNLTVYVIPVLNIDGQEGAGLGTGKITSIPPGFTRNRENRYNGNGVDINRNFDCNWTANPQDSGGVQAGRGGTAPFSEPESRALGDFIGTYRPDASIFWHSVISGGKVIAGSPDCSYDYLDAGQEMAELYATQAGYGTYEDGVNPFAYTITGDMTDWMAKIGLKGITVELPTWNDSAYGANLQATLKIIEKYGQ